MKYLFIITALLLSLTANAAVNCENATTTADINDCAAQELKGVENKLNEAYKRTLNSLDQNVQQSLITAERAWIKFREADCRARYDQYANGSMRTMVYLSCMKKRAEERIQSLSDYDRHDEYDSK